jgi:hypothetical protein
MKNLDSLIARILKAKYYPNSSFLDSSLGSRPSFAWRNIYVVKDLLHQRLIWRVGDEHSIKIWGDRWIPKPTSFMVQSPMMGTSFTSDSTLDSLMDRKIGGWNVALLRSTFLAEEADVISKIPKPTSFMVQSLMMGTSFTSDSTLDSLMDGKIGGWNVALLRSTFLAEEADVISKIPICPTFPPDCLVWQGTKIGSFFVRSAYHLRKALQQRTFGECCSPTNNSDIWKVIWYLRVPNPVKVFMWRACHNLLPTKLNLFKRKVVDFNICPCDEREEETIVHALWECPSAQDVGGCKENIFKKCNTRMGSFDLLVEVFLPRLSPDNMALLAMVAQSIWHRRNSLVLRASSSIRMMFSLRQ